MALTVKQVEALKAHEKSYKVHDSGGLHLVVTKAATKTWRMKYTLGGKEGLLTFGPFPIVTLADAREMRDAARRILLDGRDPAIERRKAKAVATAERAATIEDVCRRWHSKNEGRWSKKHGADVLHSLEKEVFKKIGRFPFMDASAPVILGVIQGIEARGAVETAHRVRQRLEAAIDFGAAELGVTYENPAKTIEKALASVARSRRQPATLTLESARTMLGKVEDEAASVVVKLAHRFMALTVARPGVLRTTRWRDNEFHNLDGDEPIWHIPSERMKLGVENKGDPLFDFVIPLAPSAVEVLRLLKSITGDCDYVFPSIRSGKKPMSENAVNYLLHRAGYHGRHTSHGWRATFSTIMNGICERRGTSKVDRDIIDLMLSHSKQDSVEAAYNRFAYMERRRELASEWADLILDGRMAPIDFLKFRMR